MKAVTAFIVRPTNNNYNTVYDSHTTIPKSDNHENLYPSPHTKSFNTTQHNDQNHIITHLVILFISQWFSKRFPPSASERYCFPTHNPVAGTFFLPFSFCISLLSLLSLVCWHSNAHRPFYNAHKIEENRTWNVHKSFDHWLLPFTWDYVNVI